MYIDRSSNTCFEFAVKRTVDLSRKSPFWQNNEIEMSALERIKPTERGILVLLFNSSGRTVKNSNNVGTVAGFLPNESIMFGTTFSQAGS
jgi:hypothetical protein